MKIIDKLSHIKSTKKTILCVGLDPEIAKMPEPFSSDDNALVDFCKEIIDATKDYAAAYKINFAFFERFGIRGWEAIEELMECIPQECITIADAKRGDVGNSAKHYATAILSGLNFDSVTVNPYMGKDSVEPFLEYKNKLIFFLGHTSNPGAQDFQYHGEVPLYRKVAEAVHSWNIAENCGLVVGATRPQQLAEIRGYAPSVPFLIPGVGAQGGTIDGVLTNLGDTNALINASRSILYASSGDDFAEAARNEATKLQEQIAPFI